MLAARHPQGPIYSGLLDFSSCLILDMFAAMRFESLRLPDRLRRLGFVT
jgi:hypothetical protein